MEVKIKKPGRLRAYLESDYGNSTSDNKLVYQALTAGAFLVLCSMV